MNDTSVVIVLLCTRADLNDITEIVTINHGPATAKNHCFDITEPIWVILCLFRNSSTQSSSGYALSSKYECYSLSAQGHTVPVAKLKLISVNNHSALLPSFHFYCKESNNTEAETAQSYLSLRV